MVKSARSKGNTFGIHILLLERAVEIIITYCRDTIIREKVTIGYLDPTCFTGRAVHCQCITIYPTAVYVSFLQIVEEFYVVSTLYGAPLERATQTYVVCCGVIGGGCGIYVAPYERRISSTIGLYETSRGDIAVYKLRFGVDRNISTIYVAVYKDTFQIQNTDKASQCYLAVLERTTVEGT